MSRMGESSIQGILSIINERVRVDEDGRLSSSVNLNTFFRVIGTLRAFPPGIALSERSGLVRISISNALRKGKGKLTESTFKAELARAISLRCEEPTERYRVVAWLVRGAAGLPEKCSWLGVKLDLAPSDPHASMPAEDRLWLSDIAGRFPSAQFDRVSFSVKARSFDHAADLADEIFSEWRGCLDFIASYRQAHWLYDGVPTPLSKVVSFPVLVISRKGEARSWYGISDTTRIGRGVEREDAERLKKYLPWVQKRLMRHFDSDRLRLAFRSYCAAVDMSNYDVCLQRLWTTLELLTDSDQSERVISRTASLCKDRCQAAEMLRYYAESRNRLAHTSRSPDIDRVLVDLLRVHVHRAFQANLLNDHKAHSFSELFEISRLACDDDLFDSAARVLRAARADRRLRARE